MPDPTVDDIEITDLPLHLGRYELTSILGKGGMAQVFGGELQGPAGFRKQVAVKVIKAKVLAKGSKRHVDFFIREARLGGLLKHPNIVDVYELGDVDGQLYIVMERIDGMTLRDFVRMETQPPASVILEIAAGITDGLASAHALQSKGRPAGLVHRDMKPSNVLISDSGLVKVADFGIAITLQGELALSEQDWDKVPGTVSYMSPEQMLGQELDGRSDIFSLGLILMELVLMEPLPRQLVLRTLSKGERLDGCIFDDTHFNPVEETVPGLGSILKRCLQIQRDDRFESTALLLEAIEGLRRKTGVFPRLRSWLQADGPPPFEHEGADSPTKSYAAAPAADTVQTTAPTVSPPPPIRSNIGKPLDRFIGREEELDSIRAHFENETRLLTVKGTGGAGKTRIAFQYARSAAERYPGGTWFVDLTEARSTEGIVQAVAGALSVPLRDGELDELITQVGSAIAGRGPTLVVLDNFEQVVGHASSTIGRWMERASDACFLVTSREPLKIRGEQIFALEPLTRPQGVLLFEARAVATGSDLQQNTKTREAIQQIVDAVDGLPLAIELAAARTSILSPEQLVERLSQRFRLLRGGSDSAPCRQATLQGLIQWSWDLLTPWEQSAMSQLSVFRDGFFMESAEEVLDLTSWPDAPWPLDVVGSLFEKSLLHRSMVLGQPRFGMYASIQEFAAGTLGESVEHVRQRHAMHYATLGSANHIEALDTTGGVNRRKALSLELENFLTGIDVNIPEASAHCALAAAEVFQIQGPYSDGVSLLEAALQLPLGSEIQERLHRHAAKLMHLAGRFEHATANYEAALVLSIESGNKHGQAMALGGLAWLQRENSQITEALENSEKALSIARLVKDKRTEGTTLGNLGLLHYERGRNSEALDCYNQALAIAQEIGNERHQGVTLGNIALLHQDQGHLIQAQGYFQQTLAIACRIGNRRSEGVTLGNLAQIYRAQGHQKAAMDHYRKALSVAREVGNQRSEGVTLGNIGDFLIVQGHTARATTHLHDAIQLCDKSYPIAAGAFRGSLALVQAQQEQMEEAKLNLELGEPQIRGVYKLELAKFLCKKAQVAQLANDREKASEALKEAESIASELRVLPESQLGKLLADTQATINTPA